MTTEVQDNRKYVFVCEMVLRDKPTATSNSQQTAPTVEGVGSVTTP